MLTGQRMYPVTEPLDYKELARKVTTGEHPLPSHFDANLAPFDSLVDRAVEPDQNKRYQSAAEFRDDIQRELVRIRPTISGDDLGLFMRHLFAEERLLMNERLKTLEEQSREAEYQRRLKDAPKTVTFAVGERFANATREIDMEDVVGVDAAPSNPRPVERPGAGKRVVVLGALGGVLALAAAIAIVLALREAASSTPESQAPDEPMVVGIDDADAASPPADAGAAD